MSKLSCFGPFQLNATCLPSGDIDGYSSCPGNVVRATALSGSTIGGVRQISHAAYPATRRTANAAAATRNGVDKIEVGFVAVLTTVDGCDSTSSSATFRSAIVWYRRPGSLRRHRRMTFSRSGEIDATMALGGVGSSVRIFVSTSRRDLPANSLRPDTSSYKIEPKLKMSDRAST